MREAGSKGSRDWPTESAPDYDPNLIAAKGKPGGSGKPKENVYGA